MTAAPTLAELAAEEAERQFEAFGHDTAWALGVALVEAARDLYASPLQVFWTVILPQTLPGILSGCVLVFVPAAGMYFISDLLGGGSGMLLGNLINNQLTVSRDWPFGAALSILMVGMTFCVMSLCRRVGGTDGTEVF